MKLPTRRGGHSRTGMWRLCVFSLRRAGLVTSLHIDVAQTATIPRSVVLALLMSRKPKIPLALLHVSSRTDQVDFLIIPAK